MFFSILFIGEIRKYGFFIDFQKIIVCLKFYFESFEG